MVGVDPTRGLQNEEHREDYTWGTRDPERGRHQGTERRTGQWSVTSEHGTSRRRRKDCCDLVGTGSVLTFEDVTDHSHVGVEGTPDLESEFHPQGEVQTKRNL